MFEPSSSPELELEGLYQSLGRELWARMYARCCNRDLALEAMQEAFLRLNEHGTQGIRDYRAWLFRVGRNWLTDAARRKRSLHADDEFFDRCQGSSADPATLAADKEVHELLRRMIGELKEDDREVLVLRYSLDWPSERIAQALGITAAAVDMRLTRARRRISEFLECIGVGDATRS